MKTFDLSLQYLKGIDFSKYDSYIEAETPERTAFMEQVKIQHDKFQADKSNTCSNDYYRSMTFSSCIYHLIDLAHGRASYWNVACEIVESEKGILKTKYEGFTEGSIYPKVMMDKFIKYCDELNPKPSFLNEKSEVRHEFFMGAFHYIIDPVS